MRTILAVITGYALWTLIWLVGNLAILAPLFPDETRAFEEGAALTEGSYLGLAILLSLFCSALAGLGAAKIAREKSRPAVLITALLLLATGIAVQVGVWSRMPLWYHLTFLALLVPVTLHFGRARETVAIEAS